MNAKTKAAVILHGRNLLAIFPHAIERDPVKLCSKLRKLEREAEALGLRLCNGPELPGGYEQADEIEVAILDKLDKLLGWVAAGVPVIINRDPRGYALKIGDDWMSAHHTSRLHRDMGGYGILAPDLTE